MIVICPLYQYVGFMATAGRANGGGGGGRGLLIING